MSPASNNPPNASQDTINICKGQALSYLERMSLETVPEWTMSQPLLDLGLGLELGPEKTLKLSIRGQ